MKKYYIFIAILSLLFSTTLLAQGKPKKFGKRAASVVVQKVEYTNTSELTEAIGRLVALDPIIVSAKINQEVIKVHFQIGDNVKKNDLLVTLESRDIIRDIKQITAELLLENNLLTLSKEQLELRLSKLKNAKNLKNKNIITQDDLDNVNILLIQNKQQIAQRKYNIKKLIILLEKARDNLNYSKILSPVNGNLISLDVKRGALTQKGKVLASILAHGSKEIEANLRSEAAAQIVVGSKVKVVNNKNIFIGKVRGVVNKENIRTGSRKVRVALVDVLPKTLNVSGTRFSLYISVGEPSAKLLIHKDALISRGRKQMVYIFNQGKAEQKFIKIGSSIGNKIEILQGLKEGQLVVIKGNENLRPNQSIKIKKSKTYIKN